MIEALEFKRIGGGPTKALAYEELLLPLGNGLGESRAFVYFCSTILRVSPLPFMKK